MLSENGVVSDVTLNMMKKRVLFRKENGEQETPLDAYKRVGMHVALGHATYNPNDYQKFLDKTVEMLWEGKFMPNTPTLVNAGFPNAQCSACFVLPVEDNLQSLYKAHYNQGLIQASGGGTGFYLGNVRSAGTKAANRFTTKGPLNWLRMYNENACTVAQGMREGANMAILDISHPDIEDFITCKKAGYDLIIEDIMNQYGVDEESAKRIKSIIGIEKFNISVSVPDSFMQKLESGDDRWDLIDPHTKQVIRTVNPRHIWDMIVENAHKHGEPGLFFTDEANRYNSLPHIGRIQTTNPCGEQPLLPYESCTLGHVNLKKFVRGMNGHSQIDWEGLEDTIRFGVQFLDGIVEVNQFPIPELAEMNRNTRRIGLGIMGWADMLAIMNIPYDSDEALRVASEVGVFFDGIAHDESSKLGQDRGNFPYFEGSIHDTNGHKYMRNSDITTIAPTGQSSMYAGRCSGGCEPIIFPVTQRNQAGMIQIDYHPALFEVLEAKGLDTPEIRKELAEKGSVRAVKSLPEDIRNAFPVSHDINHEWHVKHQAAWQKHITSAVSKTINFNSDAKPSEIEDSYWQAWKSNCKGITVYRDGSRNYQPLSKAKTDKSKKEEPIELVQIGKRTAVTHGSNRKIPNGCGNLMVYVGEGEDGRIEDVTARLGKGGGCAAAQTEAIARVSSVALRHGVPTDEIIHQLGGIRCHLTARYQSTPGQKPRMVTSCGDAISVALAEHIADKNGKQVELENHKEHVGACPNCGGQTAHTEGCIKCVLCNWSKC